MKIKFMFKYPFRRVIPIILGCGILISGIYILAHKWYNNLPDVLVHMAHGLFMTFGLWIGCMLIVKFLWKQYPWEHTPLNHLFLEGLLITAYTILFSFMLYKFEIWAGIIIQIGNPVFEIFITLLITYLITAIHEAVFFYFQWKENFSKSALLERAKMEANYETLKAQVNPHFIFNSLNSLSTLVDDKPEAIEYIQNLSEFLRYLLNPMQKELVHLKDEMEIVQNYVNLQKSRFRDNLEFVSDIPERYDMYLIPPLSIQMLIDNCLKHNIISKDKPLRVMVKVKDESIIVENNLQRKLDVNSTGQGLMNIVNRFSYFTSRKVEITETNKTFKVLMPLLTGES